MYYTRAIARHAARSLAGTPPASPLVLVGGRDSAMWLHSRTGLPSYVEVLVARTNPWFGGCPSVTVEMWTTAATPRKLDTKTFHLVDGWFDGWDDLWSWGSTLDCLNTTTLASNGYTGTVVFVMRDPRSNNELGRSGAFALTTLPTGSAIDEQPTFVENAAGTVAQVVRGAAQIAEETGIPKLLRYAVFGAAAAGVVLFAPRIIDSLDG